jgi:hypothetical protein
MENQEKPTTEENFNLNAFVAKQEDACSKELQAVLDKYNCMIVPEITISSEGIKPNLKIKFIK